MDAFTPSEKRAAHLLLSHYPFAGLDTVAEFASRAGISAPSVLRFVTRLGFGGFPDFQKHLREELEAQLLSPLAKASPSDKGQGAPALASFAEAVIGELKGDGGEHRPGRVRGGGDAACRPAPAHPFTGGRFTGALARYAESHFRIVRSNVDFIEGQPALWRDRMIEIGRKDVIVAFDIRRYQEDVIGALRNGGEAGRDGRSAHRPVALAHRPRGAACAAGPYRRSRRTGIPSAGLLLLTEALVAAVTKRLWETAKPRMEAVERLRNERS